MTIRGELSPGSDRLRLAYQACDDHSCLPLVQLDLVVKRDLSLVGAD